MNKLGSEFLREVRSYERAVIGGMTFRHLIFMIGLGIAVGISAAVILMGWPDMLLYVILPPVMIPFAIYGLHMEDKIKEMVLFRLTIQERAWLTEFESEEEDGQTTFYQAKEISEIDRF